MLVILTNILILLHPIKISVCEINYDRESERLETVIRVFYDDLDESLSKFYNKNIRISEVTEKNKELISGYLKENFSFATKGSAIPYDFLGFELEDDVIWIYLESDPVKNLDKLTVKNSLLMEEIPGQKNIVHLEYIGEIKSFALNEEKKTCQFLNIQSW